MNRKCIIIDIDNTLGFDKIKTDIPNSNKREDWDKFHEEHEFYIPENFEEFRHITDVVDNWYYNELSSPMFIFMTAREDCETVRLNTLRLIRKLFPYFNARNYGKDYMLVMRFFNDFRKDYEVKNDLYNMYVKDVFEPIIAIDDKEENVKMFKELGVPMVLQVYGGDNG